MAEDTNIKTNKSYIDPSALADDCECGDDFQFGFGYLKCFAAQKFKVVNYEK